METPSPLQRYDHHLSPTLQKNKEKEYLEMCSTIQQAQIKQYQDQMNLTKYQMDGLKQQYSTNNTAAIQQYIPNYIQKESHHPHQFHHQVHTNYGIQQKEQYQTQYFSKYQTHPHHPTPPPPPPPPPTQYQRTSYTESNNFLAHLNKIHPQMAQAIMNDPHLGDPHLRETHLRDAHLRDTHLRDHQQLRETHLRDTQLPMYHLEQGRSSYGGHHQNQRLYRTSPMQNSSNFAQRSTIQPPQTLNQNYNYKTTDGAAYRFQQYTNTAATSIQKYTSNFDQSTIRSSSPSRRSYQDNLPFNYMSMSPKISPTSSYQNCSTQLEYAQHYQHKRHSPHIQPDFYHHPNYHHQQQHHHQDKNTYLDNEVINENSTPKTNSLKQYLESWNDEEMSTNISEIAVRLIQLLLEINSILFLKPSMFFDVKNKFL